jgi:hypothetical protein
VAQSISVLLWQGYVFAGLFLKLQRWGVELAKKSWVGFMEVKRVYGATIGDE